MANDLSREDRNPLCARVNEQFASDFSPAEAEEIKRAVATADREIERGDGVPPEQFYKGMEL
ncbi:MAG: hypothetical protein ACOYMS_12280 [Terrimicrobiaceae bacterium]